MGVAPNVSSLVIMQGPCLPPRWMPDKGVPPPRSMPLVTETRQRNTAGALVFFEMRSNTRLGFIFLSLPFLYNQRSPAPPPCLPFFLVSLRTASALRC